MGFRTVIVGERCKLDYRMNHMRKRTGASMQQVFIEEIDTLVVESTAVTITSHLLQELVRRKVKVVFCDTKHNPAAELMPYAGAFDSARKVRQQAHWDPQHSRSVWRAIIARKIELQAAVLRDTGMPDAATMLAMLVDELDDERILIQEAHAARAYFAALFGPSFSRRDNEEFVNWPLNYAYTIVLSAINRHISAAGFTPLLGIFHHGPENDANLGSDLIEPLRPLIDHWIIAQDFQSFDANARHQIVDILNEKVRIDETNQFLSNAIEIYVRSVLRALSEKGTAADITFCAFPLAADDSH